MKVDDVKIFVLDGFKRIIGENIGKTINDDYIVSNPFILEDIQTQEGFAVIPIPGVPHKRTESVVIRNSALLMEPFTPADPLMSMYFKITTNIDIPTSNSIIIPK